MMEIPAMITTVIVGAGLPPTSAMNTITNAIRRPVTDPWNRWLCLEREPAVHPPANSPDPTPSISPIPDPSSTPARVRAQLATTPTTEAARLPAATPMATDPTFKAASTR